MNTMRGKRRGLARSERTPGRGGFVLRQNSPCRGNPHLFDPAASTRQAPFASEDPLRLQRQRPFVPEAPLQLQRERSFVPEDPLWPQRQRPFGPEDPLRLARKGAFGVFRVLNRPAPPLFSPQNLHLPKNHPSVPKTKHPAHQN